MCNNRFSFYLYPICIYNVNSIIFYSNKKQPETYSVSGCIIYFILYYITYTILNTIVKIANTTPNIIVHFLSFPSFVLPLFFS